MGIPTEWKAELKLYGRLFNHTSLGCYPLVYMSDSGATLCADCATAEIKEGRWASSGKKDRITMRDVRWEGSPVYCDDCGEPIESAYGDPDEDSADEQ